MPLRFFVTGGSGFIGRRVIAHLHALKHQTTNFDLRPPRREDAAYSTFSQGDLLDRRRLHSALADSGATHVIHLAAHADISADWSGFASIYDGTANLLEAIDRTPDVERLTNVSTQMVIGPGEHPRSVLDFKPYTAYGEAKALAEAHVLQWPSQRHWTTIRPAVIWGPHHPSFAKEIFRHIRARTYMHPMGRPVMRSYGYVDNTAEQIVALTLAPSDRTYRQIFYAADAVMDSAIWADTFSKILTEKRAKRIPRPVFAAMGVAGDAIKLTGVRSPIDSGRVLRMTTDYPVPLDATFALIGMPRVSFDDGVAETMRWLRDVA